MKKFIFFFIDRLGDFIIITSLIKKIKEKYPRSKIIIVCSLMNKNFIQVYKIIDKIIVYDKKFSINKKLGIFFKIIKDNYYASFVVDGKSFSYLCNLFIKSRFKLGIVYRYIFCGISFYKPNRLYNLFIFNKYEKFTSKKNMRKIEHLPTKIIELGKYLNIQLKNSDSYYYHVKNVYEQKYKQFFLRAINKKYILIHLDEKWCDIQNVKVDLFDSLLKFQKTINKIILLTSFRNNFEYYKNLRDKVIKSKTKNIKLVENQNLFMMERLIKYSTCSVSCHSGFLVQIAGANSARIIDIINKKDFFWYSSWVPKNTLHRFIFKSDYSKKKTLEYIFNNLTQSINKI